MTTESANELEQVMPRDLPRRAAPKGAAIVGVYLLGMTAIAASAYTLRDQGFSAPDIVTEITDSLPLPDDLADGEASPHLGLLSRPAGLSDAPRMAALGAPDTRLTHDLFSPLSRIFTGKPSVIPPDRPAFGQEPSLEILPDGTDIAEPLELDAITSAEPGIVTTSLRPQLRPQTLDTAPAETTSELRLASLSPGQIKALLAPEATETPSTPRIANSSGKCPNQLARDIPRRQGSARGAKAVLASVANVDGVKRDQTVLREILGGNMPGFIRNLAPVNISGRAADGSNVNITLCVTPDYLALGSDRDYVRVPLGLRAATRIGEQFNMILPTPRMVDTIYRQADLRLSPRPMTPGPQMTSTKYFMRHNATVEAQRQSAGAAPGTLISGHKKDVVLTTRLASNRGRVAIYGWHRSNGQPIQPLSTVHGAGYADYSHGVRLVSRTAFLNGKSIDLRKLMADPRYAGLLSSEGPISGPGLRMAALASN
ncbi:MAG: hypothetical protein RID23_17490 [Roseovarius sp.]